MSVEEQNIDIVRRQFDLLNENDMDAFRDLIADDFVLHEQGDSTDVRGKDAAVEYFTQYTAAFPDMRITVEDIFADGDRVVARWTGRGTHQGPLLGIQPTGTQVTVHGIEIDVVRDGRIAETWQSWDSGAMFQQIGQMPSEAALAR
jgi:steroid delta-isomerase-like uncharacterized protein